MLIVSAIIGAVIGLLGLAAWAAGQSCGPIEIEDESPNDWLGPH